MSDTPSNNKPRVVSSIPNVTASGSSGGGAGETPAWANPDIVLSAPAGIAMVTPQSASFNAGATTAVAAGQDINLVAGANAGHLVKYGISLFTYGKASNPKKPNQEVGIKLHAASGKVSSQSQNSKTSITADKAIAVNSTTDAVQIQAPKHVLLTAQGAYIKLSGGNIEVHAPGMVDFKASMKSWTGAKSDSVVPPNFPAVDLKPNELEINHLYHDQAGVQGAAFEAVLGDGSTRSGTTDSSGKAILKNLPGGAVKVRFKPDVRAYEAKPTEQSPGYKPKLNAQDWDTLIAKHGGKV